MAVLGGGVARGGGDWRWERTHGRHRDVTQNPPRVMRQIFPTATHGATLLSSLTWRKKTEDFADNDI